MDPGKSKSSVMEDEGTDNIREHTKVEYINGVEVEVTDGATKVERETDSVGNPIPFDPLRFYEKFGKK